MKRTVLITGASNGIGKETARALDPARYRIILAARREDRLQALADELRAKNMDVHVVVLDVRNRYQCEQILSNLPEPFHTPDVLINNAGLASGLSPIQGGNWEDWDLMIETNITGLLNVTKAVLPFLMQSTDPQIVNISSVAGKEAYANGNIYCATKHAVEALSQSLRIDLNTQGVRVSNVAPGMVETEFSLVRFRGDAGRAGQVYKGITALKPEDIAEAIRWILDAPAHVQICDMTITPKHQASAQIVYRNPNA